MKIFLQKIDRKLSFPEKFSATYTQSLKKLASEDDLCGRVR